MYLLLTASFDMPDSIALGWHGIFSNFATFATRLYRQKRSMRTVIALWSHYNDFVGVEYSRASPHIEAQSLVRHRLILNRHCRPRPHQIIHHHSEYGQ